MTSNVSPTGPDQNLDWQYPHQSGSRAYIDFTTDHDEEEDSEHDLDRRSNYSNEDSDDEYGNEYRWISEKIKMRRCNYYMPSNVENICQCGYSKEKHMRDAFRNPSTELKWKFSDHNCTVPTDTFGEIKFVNYGGNIGKFVRVDIETDMDTMFELMTTVWGLPEPNLLISVIGGGGKDFKMKPSLQHAFGRGLMKAANSTGAWIITGGTNAVVTQHVGEAVRDYRLTSANQKYVVAISIASWGVIRNRSRLENNDYWQVEYHIMQQQNAEGSFLDPNHSHFILVDNGTQHNFATENSFRAKLELKISQMRSQMRTDKENVAVPAVILVLGGGPDTLEEVQNALESDKPVVIVKGSGRLADILSDALNHQETVEVDPENDQGGDSKISEENIRNKMRDIEFCPEEEIGDNLGRINNCLHKSDLIRIFEWNSGSGALDMDVAILKAALSAFNDSEEEQLKLALAWNRSDIAKSEIFSDDIGWLVGYLMQEEFTGIMELALLMNRVDFVELLLDNGFGLEDFLTRKRLMMLYKKGLSRSLLKSLLHKMLGKQNEENVSLKDVRQLTQYLLDGCYNVGKNLDGDQGDNVPEEENILEQTFEMWVSTYNQTHFDNPEQELFIWSVLNNQQEMAELLWRHGEDPIAAALVASALFSAITHKADDTELIAQCKGNANKFTNLAIGVLNECYKTDKRKAQDLLIRMLPHWEKTSCVLIAANANNKRFISHPAVQDLFSNIWMGELTQGNGTLKLLMCIAIPLLIPLLITLKEEENGTLACGEQTKQKAKSPRSQSKKSFYPLKTRNDQGDETKEDGKCQIIQQKISSFYQAPVVIFFHHVMFYMVFLALYSYFLISKFEEKLSVEEIALIAWVFTFLIQETKQICSRRHKTLYAKFKSYIDDNWNKADVITILLFAVGMSMRAIDQPQTLEAARILLGFNLITFFLRLLQIFSVHKELGPMLMMILQMVGDLAYFVVIFMVFIVAYAIASHAVLHPNTQLSLDTFIAIFRRPYWNIYGELMLDEVEDHEDCTNVAELYTNSTYYRCPTVPGKYFVLVLMGFYMLICNILLLNLLIAMFSCTFNKVQADSQVIWCFQQYSLINEYNNRPLLPPPLVLFVYVLQFTKCILRRCCNKSAPVRNAFVKKFCKKRELHLFEDDMAIQFHLNGEQADHESQSVKTIAVRLDQLVNKIDELQKQQQTVKETIEDAQSSSSQMGCQSEQKTNTGADPGSTNLDKRMKNIERQLQWIIKSLNEHQLGARQAISEVTDVEV